MKKALYILSITIALIGHSIGAYAGLDDFLKNLDIQAKTDLKNFNVKLSTQFGVPVSDVDAVVKVVAHPSDAYMVFQLGHMSNRNHHEVLEEYQREHGKGWGRMAQDMGIKPGSAEFHALKRGDLHFNGERDFDEPRHGRSHGKGKKRDKRHGHGNGKGKNKGRGDD